MSDDNQNSDEIDLENGHYSEHSGSDEARADADTDEEQCAESTADGSFDTNLPTMHKYLGCMVTVNCYTLFDDGQILDSMVAIHTNTLVFPGFTLPLVLSDSSRMIKSMGNGYTFALICIDKTSGLPFDYGVIMEVFETSYKRGVIYLKAKGRQRCKILSGQDLRPTSSRMLKITVKALGEPKMTSLLVDTELRALKQKRPCVVDDYDTMLKYYHYRKYHLVQYPHASWIYDYNELCFYVKHITDGLSRYYDTTSIPKDPVILSYWFGQNFQLSHNERLQILKCNNVLERLRTELKFLKLERRIGCMFCKKDIALQKDVFVMSKDGVQNNYCNPSGDVYETVTVLYAKNYKLIGDASSNFSWFPGYSWTIMQCQRCGMHLGWQFTSKHLQPQKFFGLANGGIDIKIKEDDRDILE